MMSEPHVKPSASPELPPWEQEPEAALAAIMRMIAQSPQSASPYAMAASLLTKLGRRDEALKLIAEAQNTYRDMPLYRDSDFRLRQRQAIARGLPAILLCTQFKSGSIFIASKLREGLDLPHTYVTRTPIEDRIVPEWLAMLAHGGALAQEHLPPDAETLDRVAGSGIGRMVVHVRDPRQSLLSAVHYLTKLFGDSSAGALVARAELPDDFPGWSVARRIDHYLDRGYLAQAAWTADWIAVAKAPPAGLDILLLDYDLLQADAVAYFRRLLGFYGIAETAFDWSLLAKRPEPGTLHFRTGTTDEWRSTLSPEQQARAGAILPAIAHDYFGA
jgi:hypothetical protein